ncbi:MAG: Sensor protein CitS [Firmicutes bacterium ADurb.Bin419]|nr:MAG: Sensor protein CitS [Firmicutes bacterium ADurb.Bin419]
MNQTLLMIIMSFCTGFILIMTLGYIVNKPFSLPENGLFGSCMSLLIAISCFTIKILMPFIILIYLFVINKLSYKFSYVKSILFSILVSINYFVCDALGNLLCRIIFGKRNDHMLLPLVYIMLTCIMAISISKLLGKIISRDKKEDISKNNTTYFIMGNILISFVIVSINYITNKFLNVKDIRIYIANLILFISYIIYAIFMSYLYNKYNVKNLELMLKSEELRKIDEYSKTIEHLYESMRKFKHDYKNILLSINYYIEQKQYYELEQYYKNHVLTTKSFVETNDYAFSLRNIKISPLKALIASKLITANNNKINVFVDITEEIEKIYIDHIDAIRLFGILLDNAIEACIETEDKKLNFGAVYRGNSLVFIIENSCIPNTPPIFKLMEKGFSTKGEGRGMGLINVKEILGNYENSTFNIEVMDEFFRVEIWMRLTDSI